MLPIPDSSRVSLGRVRKKTDLLVLNTCSVTEHGKDCRYAIRKTLRHSPAFVAGPVATPRPEPQGLQTVPGIDPIVGTQYKMHLPVISRPRMAPETGEPELRHSRTIDREDFVLRHRLVRTRLGRC